MKTKLQKTHCEIEGCSITDPAMLHIHHIVERGEIDTCNNPFNLAVLCSNHHNLLHNTNRLKIIGVYPSTAKHGRLLVYELDGKKNIDIDEPYVVHKPKSMKVYLK
ncbi:hypothetical protein LCGC14_0959380 [marine sediment metagenome]|uniref:HNH nuclease domain-containing protein n=1 Tax=marine sediment metagenome TaxID=412755 RepID=A0A0F9NJL1_9ZZZZ